MNENIAPSEAIELTSLAGLRPTVLPDGAHFKDRHRDTENGKGGLSADYGDEGRWHTHYLRHLRNLRIMSPSSVLPLCLCACLENAVFHAATACGCVTVYPSCTKRPMSLLAVA